MSRSAAIGPYRILRLINRGGQGTVYLGFDDRLHRRVAIKVYRLPRNRARRRSLLHEARLVASIQSPKVVQIHDLIVASDHVALVMEYLPGCDLEEFLSSEAPSLPTIIAICIDIAGALAAARQQHIVHGDLKASNILITEQGRVKLTDFGIARGGSEPNPEGRSTASVSCVSPEQYRGKPLDIRSDLFALGCLLYRMLARKHPFVDAGKLDSEALLERMPQPVEELIEESLSIPASLSALVTSLLQKNPEDRPRNTHQVRDMLRTISRAIPLSVGNTLLQEAQACFRRESPEDIPPIIPGDLIRKGRSGLKNSPAGIWRVFPVGRSALQMGLAIIITGGIFGSILVQAFYPEPADVFVDEPLFYMEEAGELPSGLSSSWLAGEIVAALDTKADEYHFAASLPDGQKAHYSPGVVVDSKVRKSRIQSSLRCVGELCILDLALKRGGRRIGKQAIVFASMPISQWSDSVQNATRELLHGDG